MVCTFPLSPSFSASEVITSKESPRTFGNGLYVINKMGEVRNFSVPGNNNAIGLAIGPDQDILISNGLELFILRNNIILPLPLQAKKIPGHSR